MSESYAGIKFPDRAEAVGDFAGYKIFLEPWAPLADDLRRFYEALALRRESRVLAVHGPQGTGKTMFASKLSGDFVRSKEAGASDNPDETSLWHRITGGSQMNREAIVEANLTSDILLIENERDWVKSTQEWLHHRQDRRCIIIADNAERSYFRQGLVDMSDADYVQLAQRPELTAMAAERLVQHCRTVLRGALFLVLSNDEMFLLALDDAVQSQHTGLLTLTQLPMPDKQAKETVVRVNTNRLNGVSYWYCLDKAGPSQKASVKTALEGASTFPDSFAAVDNAIRTADPSRTGRPAKQNLISLIVCTSDDDVTGIDASNFGQVLRTEASRGWLASHVYSSGWAPVEIGQREASLLESEWVLRLVFLGRPFVQALVEIGEESPAEAIYFDAVLGTLESLKTFHGPGAQGTTRSAYTASLEEHVANWPAVETVDLKKFWAQGQTRSVLYESALRKVLPGYNAMSSSFLKYRPDFVVSPFRPCSILSAVSDDQTAINAAIRRESHVFEFTALAKFDDRTVKDYLRHKLPNYVEVTQEQ